jgi:hypothetical protein
LLCGAPEQAENITIAVLVATIEATVSLFTVSPIFEAPEMAAPRSSNERRSKYVRRPPQCALREKRRLLGGALQGCNAGLGGLRDSPVRLSRVNEHPKEAADCNTSKSHVAYTRNGRRFRDARNLLQEGATLMNTPGFLKCAGAVVALVIVSACGSGSTLSPSAATVAPSAATRKATYVGKTLFLNGRPVTAARLNPLPRYAELVPDASKSTKYEYIFNFYGSYASIFDYPKSTAMIGQIQGLGGQGCTNVLYGYGKNIFWNAQRTNDLIVEYQVPDTLLRSLTLGYTFTSSCAMNTNGDLAVGVLLGNSYGPGGQVVIFKNAQGSGKVYNTPLDKEYFDGYDPSGNLFADGEDVSGNFELVELPKGHKKFVTITTSNSPEFPGSVQWDGTFITVFDQLTSETYRYTVSGTTATLKKTVQYSGASDCAQTWIVKGMLYCGDAGNDDGAVYKYPAGGAPIATFTGDFDLPLGVTAAKT